MTELQLWEILVPTIRSDGKPYRTRFHRVWDQKIREAVGCGMTIFQPAKGTWVHPDVGVLQERMIPVRIACTEDQMRLIAVMTRRYYEQHTVMYYRISDSVFFHTEQKKVPIYVD